MDSKKLSKIELKIGYKFNFKAKDDLFLLLISTIIEAKVVWGEDLSQKFLDSIEYEIKPQAFKAFELLSQGLILCALEAHNEVQLLAPSQNLEDSDSFDIKEFLQSLLKDKNFMVDESLFNAPEENTFFKVFRIFFIRWIENHYFVPQALIEKIWVEFPFCFVNKLSQIWSEDPSTYNPILVRLRDHPFSWASSQINATQIYTK